MNQQNCQILKLKSIFYKYIKVEGLINTTIKLKYKIEGISWRAPERDWVALNTDGSMVELGSNAACRGILRDSDSCFLVAFAARLHNVSVLEAKLWGIYHGLKLAWERGFRKIIVYSDSLIAINLLKDGCPSLILYVPL